ncbi:MAG: hypothetical protein QW273_03820 [Candidatus Pacearchaeota archaeon]
MKRILLALVTLLIITKGILAYGGVTPSSYEIDFKPNHRQSFLFNYFFSPESKAELEVKGDLSQYVTLNKKILENGRGEVIALLELPEKIETPGVHNIVIYAKELPPEESGISVSFSVGGVIKVKVPYPGKYAEGSLSIPNANAGDLIKADLEISSKGEEDINVHPVMKISPLGGEPLETIDFGIEKVESTKTKKFSKVLKTEGYLPGDYNASVFVEYGGEKPLLISSIFRLGHLFVNITNYTNELEREKINRFVIEVESFWNLPIENLYGEVSILNYTERFRTPSISLDPWKKTIITTFIDTTNIKEDTFYANITLFYHNTTTSRIVELRFKNEKNTGVVYFLIGILLTILLIFFLVYLKRKKSKKDVEEKRKKKK